jgi:hypothetical protein
MIMRWTSKDDPHVLAVICLTAGPADAGKAEQLDRVMYL